MSAETMDLLREIAAGNEVGEEAEAAAALWAINKIVTLRRQLECTHRNVVSQADGRRSACTDCKLEWRYYPARREILS